MCLKCQLNFNYCIKAVILFMSGIVINKLSTFHKILFWKLEKDLKCFIKFDTDIQFLFLLLLLLLIKGLRAIAQSNNP